MAKILSSESTSGIADAIKNLREKRPIFHSEADFQHALAWEIHLSHPLATVRLEINPNVVGGKRAHLDILVKDNDALCAIELKYKTGKLDAQFKDEQFRLLNHGAQDIGRYDFIKDIVRLEELVTAYPKAAGYVVLLTNDGSYWRPPGSSNTADAQFRIYQDRIISGNLEWSANAGKSTMRGREKPLQLTGSYQICWFDYSQVGARHDGEFRYTLIAVPARSG